MIEYRHNPVLDRGVLNDLLTASWVDHYERDFGSVLERSLGYVGAYDGARLVGFVNMAWDGGQHAFLLDTTVHPDFRRQGIGTRMVAEAITMARHNRMMWIHVDYEPALDRFYRSACGFRPTSAGLLKLE